MKEIVNKLHESRQIELAKSILEANGYTVEMSDKLHEDDRAYQEFLKKCQDNATWKKVNAICEKHGYKLSPLSYVDVSKSGKKTVNISFIKEDRYRPEIFYSSRFGAEPTFQIQTTAFGALDLIEHAKFIAAVTAGHNMISMIQDIDLTTLYQDTEE